MNLFELNARMAVKLGQSFDTLYELEYLEYSLLLNIINADIEAENERITEIENMKKVSNKPFRVNLPDNLKLK